jgi:replicative DNA helicase
MGMNDIDQLPYSPHAEEAVLGCLLIDPEAIKTLHLSDQDFYRVNNQMIFTTMQLLYARGQAIDFITICSELEKHDNLAEVGGAAYLMSLVNASPHAFHLQAYADIVREKARRRKVIQTCQRLTVNAFNEESNLDTGIAQAATELVTVARPVGGAIHIKEFISQAYDDALAKYNSPKEMYGIPTGIEDFDRITSGLQPGELLVLSGEPGLGKSLLAFQMCAGMAGTTPGAIYELEMSGLAVVRRYLSRLSKVTTYKMRTGKMESEDWEAYGKAVEAMAQLPIYLSDACDWTAVSLRADLAQLKEKHNISWFLVDYLVLLADVYGDGENERTAHLAQEVAKICKDLDLAGIGIQSMNKMGFKTSGAAKENLSGSGALGYAASAIWFMTKPDENNDVVRLTCDKMREGDGDRFVDLLKVKGFPSFEPVTRKQPNAQTPTRN